MRARRPSPRDRPATEERFLEAVETILRRDGLVGLGVNVIAREANANKALLYRYFGDLDGLYRAFSERTDVWPTIDELLGPNPESLRALRPSEVAAAILGRYAKALRTRPLTIELLAGECTHRNGLIVALEELRERRSRELYAELAKLGVVTRPGAIEAVALVSGAINYFVIRSRAIRIFGGADIHSERGWAALGAAWSAMLRTIDEPT
jgi:AcrR family transcriptional regulator